MPRQSHLEMTPHVRPLTGEDAVHHRIAHGAVLSGGVVTDDAISLRAETFYRSLRPEIEIVRAQTHDLAAERFERMPEQQEFARGVDVRALTALRIPRVANLDAIERGDDVVIARGADNPAAR